MSTIDEALSGSRVGANTTVTSLRVALRSLRQHPRVAVLFLVATLTQGALQGAMIWALREVLITLGGRHGVAGGALLGGGVGGVAVGGVRSAGGLSAPPG